MHDRPKPFAQALSPKAAIPARAKRTTADQAGPRKKGQFPTWPPPEIHTRVTGNGTKESEQVARVANAGWGTLEKDLADLLNRALTCGQLHASPLPRALARDYLHAEREARVTTVLRDQAASNLKQARRARHHARYYRDQSEIGLKGKDKLA